MNAKPDLLSQAQVFFKQGAKARSVALLRQLAETKPPLKERWVNAAKLASALQDSYVAEIAQDQYLKTAKQTTIGAHLDHTRYLHEMGRFEEALDIVNRLVKQHPDHPNAIYASAYMTARLQDNQRSIDLYRKAALLDTSLTTAWSVLTKMKKIKADDEDIAHMRRIDWELRDAAPNVRAPIRYGLGYAMEQVGNTEAAFAMIRSGAEMMKAYFNYSENNVDGVFEQLQNAMTQEVIDSAEGVESNRPIFVIGAPRAGTTLVESILTAHSDVTDGAELSFLSVAGYRPHNAAVKFGPKFHEALTQESGGRHWKEFGNFYLKMAEERFGADGRFVDSTTTSPWQTGWILSALPNAKIIWMTRNRQDALWAIYKVYFAASQGFSYDFHSINERLDRILSLRDHFMSLRPDAILPVQYEDLARDPDIWIPKILEHCDLDYQEGVRNFHESGRIVNTASITQVREPISTKSIGSWRRYEEQLGPTYKDLLGPNYMSLE